MKNKIYFLPLLFMFLLVITPARLRSQSFTGSNLHDSLLFDGDDANSLTFKKTDDCRIKVSDVYGEVWATRYVKKVVKECKLDTVEFTEKTLISKGDELKAGDIISIAMGHPGFASLDVGDNVEVLFGQGDLHGAQLMVPSDYCKYDYKYPIQLSFGSIWAHFKRSLKARQVFNTQRCVIGVRGTQFSLQTVQDGDKTTDILKVYEGSVEFRQNFEGEGFKKGTEDWQEEMKKLNEDFQNGKITAQEYKEKFAEIQNKIKSNISTDPNYFVTVNAGYKSSITDANKPTDPEPFDTNADRWWEDMK